jgi:hypothetical protein
MGDNSFTRRELLAVSAILLILVVLVSLTLPSRKKVSQISCANNLRNIGFALDSFASDHQGNLPSRVSTNEGGCREYLGESNNGAAQMARSLAPYLSTPHSVSCPADVRKSAHTWSALSNTNVSYFFSIDGDLNLSRAILAGDRNISSRVGASDILIAGNPYSWIPSLGLHSNIGHLLFGAGRAQRLTSDELKQEISLMTPKTNRILLP